jgi:hypothetical protein
MISDIIYTFREQSQQQLFFSTCNQCEHNKNQICELMSSDVSQITKYNEFHCILGKWEQQ